MVMLGDISGKPLRDTPSSLRFLKVVVVGIKAGDRLKYPEDRGIMCPWLLDSVSSMIRVLRYGGTLPWKYEGTPYEKEIDPEGITTEFVRCPDPTSSGVVLKIIRKKEQGNKH